MAFLKQWKAAALKASKVSSADLPWPLVGRYSGSLRRKAGRVARQGFKAAPKASKVSSADLPWPLVGCTTGPSGLNRAQLPGRAFSF